MFKWLLRVALPLAAVFLLIVAAAGCTSDDNAGGHNGAGDDDTHQNGDDDADNDDDSQPGDDDANPPTLDDTIQAMLEEYLVFSGEPGVTFAVQRGDDAIFSHAAGLSNILENKPMMPDYLFRVGSCSKPFTATVIMQLADEGVIDLDALMTTYLPQYTVWPNVTVRHLVRMQSGIPDYLFSPVFWINCLLRLGEPMSPETVVMYAMMQPIEFEPGEDCSYSNTNFVLLGMIIEAVTGHAAGFEIWNRIVKPLDLQHTFLDIEGNEIETLTHGYADAELAGIALGLPADLLDLISLIPPEYIIEGLLFDGTYLFHPSFSFTAGGVVSYADDLVKFMKAYVNGELVSEEMYEGMMDFSPCVCLDKPVDYSMAMMRRPTEFGLSYGHGGMHFGYTSNTYFIPDIDVMYSLLDNFIPDQSDFMLPELLRAVVENDATPPAPCRPPEDFFTRPDEYNLQVRFRGAINTANAEEPDYGVSSTKVLLDDGQWHAYYIDNDLATLDGLLPLRVQVETYGPSSDTGFNLRGLVLNIRARVFDEADEDGLITIEPGRADDVYLYLTNVALDENGVDANKICLTAVPNRQLPGYLYLCDRDTFEPLVGKTLKLFGAFAMDWDEDNVVEYADTLGIAACECKGEEGQWNPCPDTPPDDDTN